MKWKTRYRMNKTLLLMAPLLAAGYKFFTSASSEAIVDNTTFAVTYNVYMAGDPHCCPSGGTATVQFHWDGSRLVTAGSMRGAEMS